MKNIKIILNENKTFTAENIDEVKILEDEHNATVIEVHFPEDYANYSKRVDFLNIRNEKWTTSLYAPEDENNKYSETFDKSVFRFTIPSAMAKRGELQIQFIAYLVDGSNTIVPFQVILATINKSIIYAVKEGRENPDFLIQAYEYSNKALETAREALDKTANAERAALEAEKSAKSAENSAKNAENSAKSAQTSANSANTRATNAEASAKAAQESAEYAEEVSNTANTKSDNAVKVSNEANTKSTNAVETANIANENSEEALEISNQANTKSTNAVNTSNSANTKADNAVATSNDALVIAQEAKDIANTANTKSDNAVDIATEANTKSDNAVTTATSADTKSNQAVTTANEAKTSATSAVNTASSANTKSNTAVNTANSANTKSDNAVSVANEAKTIADEALNQVVSKMGTKVFVGNNETPESNLNFDSDPQTQITANKTLSNSNKSRIDAHDTTIAGHTTTLSTHDTEINSAKTRITNLENQPIIKNVSYDESSNTFTFNGTSNITNVKSTNVNATTMTATTGNFTNINNQLNMKDSMAVYTATIAGNNSYSGYAIVTTRNKTESGSGKIMLVDVHILVNVSSLVSQNSNQTCTITISGISTSEYTNINAFLECSLTQATMAVTNDYMNSHACEQESITRSSTGLTLKVSIRRAYSEGNVYGWLHTKVLLTKN